MTKWRTFYINLVIRIYSFYVVRWIFCIALQTVGAVSGLVEEMAVCVACKAA